MKNGKWKITNAGLIGALALLFSTLGPQLATVFAQGGLTPPGAPAPTMKTLDQIEPRIDVAKLSGDASSHFVITIPGSYFLSANLMVTNARGITIAAAGVTLDLNGFEIARLNGVSGEGIRINSGSDRATVRNGSLRGFGTGIEGTVGPAAKGCLFEKLSVTGCSSYGMFAGESARVIDCRAHDNTGSGIAALKGSAISGCTARNNQGSYGIFGRDGCNITGCTAQENQCTYAIRGDFGSVISHCAVEGNQCRWGIYGDGSCTISDCTVANNTGVNSTSYGIYGDTGTKVMACTVTFNFNTNSPKTSLMGVGIYADGGSMVKNCVVSFNQGDGIRVTGNCLVQDNVCDYAGNGGSGAGIHTTSVRNRIEGNMITISDRGIEVDTSNNLIIRNCAGNNGTNYVIAANNAVGVIVVAPDSLAISGDTGGAGVGSTSPWANFSY